MHYSRILIKFSGEALSATGYGIDPDAALTCARELAALREQTGCQIALVVGGGNLWRGARGQGLKFPRSSSDQIGMMATVMNAIALQTALESCGLVTIHQTAMPIAGISSGFDQAAAVQALKQGHLVLFSGGTGQPFFSTDTASALRAAQVGAQALLKATQVDGIYDQDPREHRQAQRIAHLSYTEAIRQQLRIMDLTAFEICAQAGIDIKIFKNAPGHFLRALREPDFGSTVTSNAALLT